MFEVRLIQKPVISDFRSDYFPRKFRLKTDALRLVREVEAKGGKAEIVRIK